MRGLAPPYRCTRLPSLQVQFQPTPTTSTQLVAPPFRCTCLLPFPNSSNKSLSEHLAASPYGAPAKPPCQLLYYIIVDLSCHIPMHSSTAPRLRLLMASPYRGTCSNGEGQKKIYIYKYICIYTPPSSSVFEVNAKGTSLRMTAEFMG